MRLNKNAKAVELGFWYDIIHLWFSQHTKFTKRLKIKAF